MLRRQPRVSRIVSCCLGALGLFLPAVALAEEDRAVAAGVQYLKAHAASRPTGETAMIALGLVKAESTRLRSCLAGMPGQDPDAIHERRLFAGDGTGTRHVRGGRDGDGLC